jgi:hypothetical protein
MPVNKVYLCDYCGKQIEKENNCNERYWGKRFQEKQDTKIRQAVHVGIEFRNESITGDGCCGGTVHDGVLCPDCAIDAVMESSIIVIEELEKLLGSGCVDNPTDRNESEMKLDKFITVVYWPDNDTFTSTSSASDIEMALFWKQGNSVPLADFTEFLKLARIAGYTVVIKP